MWLGGGGWIQKPAFTGWNRYSAMPLSLMIFAVYVCIHVSAVAQLHIYKLRKWQFHFGFLIPFLLGFLLTVCVCVCACVYSRCMLEWRHSHDTCQGNTMDLLLYLMGHNVYHCCAWTLLFHGFSCFDLPSISLQKPQDCRSWLSYCCCGKRISSPHTYMGSSLPCPVLMKPCWQFISVSTGPCYWSKPHF